MYGVRTRRGVIGYVLTVVSMVLIAGVIAGVSNASAGHHRASITKEPFGTVDNPTSPSDGLAVDLYTLTNGRRDGGQDHDVRGRSSSRSRFPTGDGTLANVTLGFDNLDQYVNQNPYFGNITGRYANRIALGQFTLDGVAYQLADQQRPQQLARWRLRVRQAGVGGGGDRRRSTPSVSVSPTPARTGRRTTRAPWRSR